MESAPVPRVSVLVPLYNEAAVFPAVFERLQRELAGWPWPAELIVVDDGSDDGGSYQSAHPWVRVLRHPVNLGNGAAVKTGIRAARGEYCVVIDADGQHDGAQIPRLVALLADYPLAVGARDFRAGLSARNLANRFFCRFASYMTGFPIADLTCGFRAFRREEVLDVLHLFPNRFSCPTTMTMAMIRMGYPVAFAPIESAPRPGQGTSKIRPMRDGLRFLIIILKVSTLFAPMRVFFPLALFLGLFGFVNYVLVLTYEHRFSLWSLVLFMSAITIFMIGLLAEGVSFLNLRRERR